MGVESQPVKPSVQLQMGRDVIKVTRKRRNSSIDDIVCHTPPAPRAPAPAPSALTVRLSSSSSSDGAEMAPDGSPPRRKRRAVNDDDDAIPNDGWGELFKNRNAFVAMHHR